MLGLVALVSTTKQVPLAETAKVAAALQKQVSRDLAPIWGLQGCVAAFASLKDMPIGYWPMLVTDDIPDPSAAGVHLDRYGRPFCLIEFGPTWTLMASHECIELLVDPSGNRQVSGPSAMLGQGEVGYLVEVCDPCEDTQHGYTIDGVLVSDFCTPDFFESGSAAARFSFTGAVKKPLEVLRNGYLSWHDPVSRAWYQEQRFGSTSRFVTLGMPGPGYRCMREFTNRGEADHRRLAHFSAAQLTMPQAQQRLRQHAGASAAAADLLNEEIAELGRRLGQPGPRRRRKGAVS